MRYYPVNLDIQKRRCLVVGGGGVGTRKAAKLLACGAEVTVVSPEMTDELFALAGHAALTLKERAYRTMDLEHMFLVIGATDDEELNRRISADAAARNMLCNIADRPEVCNFILPAIIHRGDLVITISTSGKSPAFAKQLRRDLESHFGPEYADFLNLMGAIRKKLLSTAHEPEVHKPLFEKMIARGLIEMIKGRQTAEIDALLMEVLGEGYEFEALMRSTRPVHP